LEARTAIPGFTFLLFVILLNHNPLREFLLESGKQEVFGVIFVILSLLGGSAIGFQVTRIWLFLQQRFWLPCDVGKPGKRELRGSYGKMVEEFSLKSCKEKKCKEICKKKENRKDYNKKRCKRRLIVFWGYLMHKKWGEKKTKEHVNYAQKRWDIYQLLSSELITIAVAIIFGIIIRIFWFNYEIIKDIINEFNFSNLFLSISRNTPITMNYARLTNFSMLMNIEKTISLEILELFEIRVYVITIISGLLLMCLAWYSRGYVNFQYEEISKTIIAQACQKNLKEELKPNDIFGPDYFLPETKSAKRREKNNYII
jgi:hypothetical protein